MATRKKYNMPRALFLFLTNLALAAIATAQNLVPNPSFEEFTECPDYWAQVPDVVGWGICGESPDYFNECRSSDDFGVPLNVCGFQFASDGAGYVGVITYNATEPTYREIVCAPLVEPLQPGVEVHISFKAATGAFGSTWGNTSPAFAAKGIGILFSMQPLTYPWLEFPSAPALHLDQVLQDTLNWVVVSGTYLPDSAYEYINIGNFFPDSSSSPVLIDSVGAGLYAYAFVDEICVTEDPEYCASSESIVELASAITWTAVTPFSEELILQDIKGSLTEMQWDLFSVLGAKLRSGRIKKGESQLRIDTSSLSDGSYILQLRTGDDQTQEMVVVHSSF